MQNEVEIKIKLEQKLLDILLNWLKKSSSFIGSFSISDYYVNNPNSSFYTKSELGYKDALKFLRIRVQDDKNFICFKKREVNNQGKTISVGEAETKVEDAGTALKILEYSGFVEQVELKKKRTVYIYDQFEFVIDEFEKLGLFVEIELKEREESVEIGLQKIYSLLKKIGITEFTQFDRGYIVIFLNPDFNFGQKVTL